MIYFIMIIIACFHENKDISPPQMTHFISQRHKNIWHSIVADFCVSVSE